MHSQHFHLPPIHARAVHSRAVHSRREWLQQSGAALLALPCAATNRASGNSDNHGWRMGLIADLHYGLANDALSRLDVFMESVLEQEPDCILQLGDFNFGVDSEDCMRAWEQFSGPRHHVLGNHDMDKSRKAYMLDRWGMPNRYYSFDFQGWHVVVLDRNNLQTGPNEFTPYENANFYVDASMRGFADPEQLEWLAADLEQTPLPTVVFAHQGLGMTDKIEPDTAAGRIETILNEANRTSRKVRACFCGHHHLDRYHRRNGIHYVWINSASYYWVGSKYGRMAAYTEPLFTYLTFRDSGEIEVAASQSSWAAPTPQDRGVPNWRELTPFISHHQLT